MLSGMGAIMKIVHVAPLVPYLTDALVAMGYDVMLFASGDSIAHAKSEEVWPKGLRRDRTKPDAIAPVAVARVRSFQVEAT
jgi:hypothetical protein